MGFNKTEIIEIVAVKLVGDSVEIIDEYLQFYAKLKYQLLYFIDIDWHWSGI